MRKMTAEQLDREHREALAEFDEIQQAVRPQRMAALEDRRFYSEAGAQWDGAVGEQFETKPRFELNRTHLAVLRVVNEYRNNRVTVDFVPKDGSEADDLADACDGLFRADEQNSAAEEAYDTAFEEACAGGYGAWRLRADYEDDEDDENDRQRVRIEAIPDAESCVFFDLNAKRQDKADAKRCYVLTPYSRKAYKDEWGDDPASWPRAITKTEFDWATPDLVWVCERYKVVETREKVYHFRAVLLPDAPVKKVTQAELDEDPALMDRLLGTGFVLAKEKTVTRRRVRKLIFSGGKALEDCGFIAGRHIPIVMTYGKRWVIDGVERSMGHVRLAKDAQRLSNMLMSWLADLAGQSPREKPIFTPEQIAGHAQRWAEDNVRNFPYLLVNAVTDTATGQPLLSGPVGYTKPPQVPQAWGALAQMAEGALKELLGAQERGEEMKANVSGKVVEMVQQRLDMQSFIYMSNFARAMKRSGEIWLGMMRDLAAEPDRVMKSIGPDGKPGQVTLNQKVYDAESADETIKMDMARASFDVVADVGPSSSSKRAATVRSLTGLLQMTADPEMQVVLTSAALMNLEGEGMADFREFARRRLLRIGAVKPTDAEREEMAAAAQGQQPDPQSQFLLASAAEAEANAADARAATVQKIADAELKRAKTAETLANVQNARVSQVLDVAETFQRAAQAAPAGPLAPPIG